MSKNTLIPTWVFVGRAKCGCIRAASVDDGTKQCAEDVAGFIRDGLNVERVSESITIAYCPHRGSPVAPFCGDDGTEED